MKSILNPQNIIAACEGIKKEGVPLDFPNFHALQYYSEDPFPQIIGVVLDFGLTAHTPIEKLNPDQPNFLEKLDSFLEKSFKDMSEFVVNYLFDICINYDFENMYKFAIPHPFIEDAEVNPWGDFIKFSRESKIRNFKLSVNNFLIKILEIEYKSNNDSSIKQLIFFLKEENQKELGKVKNQIKELFKTQPEIKKALLVSIAGMGFEPYSRRIEFIKQAA